MTTTTSKIDQDIEDVVRDWELLKDERANVRTGPSSRNRIGTILRFMGLPYANEKEITTRREGPRGRRVHFTFQADPQIVSSVKGAPQFGSLANGNYHIFCLWEDARPDRIYGNRTIRNLAQGGQGAVIVFYLNALSGTERQDLRRES